MRTQIKISALIFQKLLGGTTCIIEGKNETWEFILDEMTDAEVLQSIALGLYKRAKPAEYCDHSGIRLDG